MKVRDLFRVIKFLRNTDSCIILRDDLLLSQFGKYSDTMMKFNDAIMHISIKDK